MLGNLFQGILLTSCLGILLTICLLVIKPKTQKHFSSRWHYYIWIAVLIVMMLPIRFRLPEITMPPSLQKALIKVEYNLHESFEEICPVRPKQEVRVDEKGRRIHSLELFLRRLREIEIRENLVSIAPIWLSIAVLVLLVRLAEYMFFLRKIHKSTRRVTCPRVSEFTKRKVIVRTGERVTTPLLLGVFRPILLLPEKQMTESQLNNILVHEMTHLKRNDMLLKWLVVVVKCVHWFNPMVYVIGKQMDQECEISCDMSVTEHMSKDERISYVDTILAFLQRSGEKEISMTMGMAGCKKQLRKRFMRMKNRLVISRSIHMLARTAAVVFLVSAALISGEMMCNLFPYMGELDYTSQCDSCKNEIIFYKKDLSEKLIWNETVGFEGTEGKKGLLMATDTKAYQIEQFYEMYFKCRDCETEWTEQHAIGDPKAVDVYKVKVDRYGLILQ